MKRIEVKLSLGAVAPLLDVIKAASDSLAGRLATHLTLEDVDPDFREEWQGTLLESQKAELDTLLGLFDSEFFSTGVIGFDEDNAAVILRACAAVRLRLRDEFLNDLPDEVLEGGDVEIENIDEPIRRAFMCYLFLATIEEIIIQHLESAILGK